MLEVNTFEHINMFSKYVKSYDETTLKNYISHEEIDISKFSVDDNLNFLLYMGIGIYTKNIDTNYSLKILEMLNNRELSYIIADETFCYGANYEISNVIICDDIGDDHSINTILQLIGRTSRIGKSWSGKVYLDKNTRTRIIEFFKNPSFSSNEGTNIHNYFNIISEKILAENNKKISDIIKKEENEKNKLQESEKKKMNEIINKEREEERKVKKEEEERLEKEEEVYSSWREIRDTPRNLEIPIRRINTISEDISLKNNTLHIDKDMLNKSNSFDNWTGIRDKEPTLKSNIKSSKVSYDFSGWDDIRNKDKVIIKENPITELNKHLISEESIIEHNKIEIPIKKLSKSEIQASAIYRKFELSTIDLFKNPKDNDIKKDNKKDKSSKKSI